MTNAHIRRRGNLFKFNKGRAPGRKTYLVHNSHLLTKFYLWNSLITDKADTEMLDKTMKDYW